MKVEYIIHIVSTGIGGWAVIFLYGTASENS